MRSSLTLNHQDQLALFYNEPLGFEPEWASIDIAQGEIYISGPDTQNRAIKFDNSEERIQQRVKTYAHVEKEAQILLILVSNDAEKKPLHTVFIPLTVSRQF